MSLPKPPDVRSADGAISLEDFYAIPNSNRFMFLPARTTWPKESVDCILPKILTGEKRNGKFVKIKPSDWLKQHRRVEQVTWMPGLPEVIEGKLLFGWRLEGPPWSACAQPLPAPAGSFTAIPLRQARGSST